MHDFSDEDAQERYFKGRHDGLAADPATHPAIGWISVFLCGAHVDDSAMRAAEEEYWRTDVSPPIWPKNRQLGPARWRPGDRRGIRGGTQDSRLLVLA